MTADDDFRHAMDLALRLLKFRARTRAELADRLKRKKVEAALVPRVVDRLTELKLVDDAELARQTVESRRRANQGDHRIRRDLRKRGLGSDAVEDALAAAETPAGSDADRAWEALRRRAGRMKALDPRVARRRLEGYLFRQGFDADDVRSALRRFFSNQGEDE
ncbi:MAG TPA: regulatory protein RecX [Elusimicrobiota bacterium]|nr:regulatory protein RecX [Elusimicrobiota bacterium]HMZ27487.1 regulatory protein RecX [Elusimicrobiota bacterium]HNA60686.1 regulatory protein RecX [Elusimicrobiota bacterium]HNC74120.1 regulatory protein RecX [Elusimicrobiota bacterium]HND63845.1 regulatory protein RecX [Elusimicrobiota bacterium]